MIHTFILYVYIHIYDNYAYMHLNMHYELNMQNESESS